MIETDTQATLPGRFRGIEPENCPGSNEVPMPSSSCSTTWTSTCTAARPSFFSLLRIAVSQLRGILALWPGFPSENKWTNKGGSCSMLVWSGGSL